MHERTQHVILYSIEALVVLLEIFDKVRAGASNDIIAKVLP